MKQVNNREIILVEVPENSNGKPYITNIHGDDDLVIGRTDSGVNWLGMLPGEKGSWQLLGKGSELTEEQWEGIVEKASWWAGHNKVRWIDYEHAHCGPFYTYTATESGHSLLKANGFKPETVIGLIKK